MADSIASGNGTYTTATDSTVEGDSSISSNRAKITGVDGCRLTDQDIILTWQSMDEEKLYMPAVKDGSLTVTWQRRNAPGKMAFTAYCDDVTNFQEGDICKLYYGGNQVFRGFIFQREYENNQTVKIICYDQLRYFKNKVYGNYENKTATFILLESITRAGANAYETDKMTGLLNLNGTLDDTGVVLSKYHCVNRSVFDILNDVLGLTYQLAPEEKRRIWTIYDDFGTIRMKGIPDMDVPIIIDEETARTYTFSSSVENAHNRIQLYYENSETGEREWYEAQNSLTIGKWGLLNEMKKLEHLPATVTTSEQAKIMLENDNHPAKKIRIKGAFGDCRVRGGSRIWVRLKIPDDILKMDGSKAAQLFVDQVTHNFSQGEYTMDLTLVGKGLIP